MGSNPRNVSPLCYSDMISEQGVPWSIRCGARGSTRLRLRLPKHAEQGKPALITPKVLRGFNSEVKFREDSDL